MLIIKEDHVYGLFMLIAKLRIVKVQGVIDNRPLKFRIGNEEMQVNHFKISWIAEEDKDE